MHEGSGSDDAKVREVGFLTVKHLKWRLHLERLVWSLFLRYAAAMNSSSHMDNGKPLFASMHRTMVHRVLPTRLDTSICCDVLVTNSWIIPVSK